MILRQKECMLREGEKRPQFKKSHTSDWLLNIPNCLRQPCQSQFGSANTATNTGSRLRQTQIAANIGYHEHRLR